VNADVINRENEVCVHWWKEKKRNPKNRLPSVNKPSSEENF